MEFRKEKSAKSKELIKIHSKSNIFNIDTEYYKTEKIFPISRKPNEIGKRLIEFTPKYKEIKPYQRKYEDSLSDLQKRFTDLLNFKPNQSTKNFGLETQRTRNKEIKGYCCDNKGNISSRKLYILDTYGTRDIINNSKKKYLFYNQNNNENNLYNNTCYNKNIKEKRKYLKYRDKIRRNSYLKTPQNKNNNMGNIGDLNNMSISKTNFYSKKYNYNNKNDKNNNIENDLDEINNLMDKLSTKEKKDTLNYIRNIIYNKNKNKERNKNLNKKKYIIIKSTKGHNGYDKNKDNQFLYKNNTVKAKTKKEKEKENDNNEKRFKNSENNLNKNKIKIKIKKSNDNLSKKKRKGTPGIRLKENNEIE